MSRIIFPSLVEPKHRYAIYQRYTENPARSNGFCDRLTAFDTYGDGDTQHCNEWSPQPDALTDFLESLLVYLSMHAGDQDTWQEHMQFWPDPPHAGTMRPMLAFCCEPLYKEDKHSFHRYYNLRECKVSTAASKQHDKRWNAVESWMDGSFSAVMRMMTEERTYGLLGLYSFLRFTFENTSFGRWDARKWLEQSADDDRRLWTAFEAVDDFILAARRWYHVRKWTEHRVERMAEERKAIEDSAQERAAAVTA